MPPGRKGGDGEVIADVDPCVGVSAARSCRPPEELRKPWAKLGCIPEAPPSSSRPRPGPHGAPSSGPLTCWPPAAALLSSVPTPPPSHARWLQRTPGADSGPPLSPAGRQLTPARPDAVKGKQRRSLGSRSRPGGRKTSTLVSLGKRIHCDAMAPEMNGPKTVEGRSLFGITSRDKRSWS